MEKPKQVENSHAMVVLFLGVVTFCVVGYFIGLVQPKAEGVGGGSGVGVSGNGAVDALAYREITGGEFGENSGWGAKLSDARLEPVDLFTIVAGGDVERVDAVLKRAGRRAFDGAPPTVPHKIDQMSVASCLTCHGEGMKIGEVVVPKMSHQRYDSCTQCHVEGNAGKPVWRESEFTGLTTFGLGGDRAYAGAPPTVPHPTFMRESCTSCHGPTGVKGLRSSHPYRDSCLQCHGPSAEFDQR